MRAIMNVRHSNSVRAGLSAGLGVLVKGSTSSRVVASVFNQTLTRGTTLVCPILEEGPDPWVIHHQGHYYLTCTTGDGVHLWKSRTLGGLGQVEPVKVWSAPSHGPCSRNVWAPELHWVDGSWYIYLAADDGNDFNHRMWVLRATSDDPLGGFELIGKIHDCADQWAIDGTVLQLPGGRLFLVWSGWNRPPGPQNLYIAPMSYPWALSGPRVCISRPEHDWEKRGWPVNEGPAILQRNGRIFIVYSASGGSTEDYCLGMLTCEDGNVLNPASWTKTPQPVFCKHVGDLGSVYTTGHCSFVRSPDGREDWMVYHGKDTNDGGWRWRSVRAQRIGWNGDDTPNLGTPIPAGVPMTGPSGEEQG